MFSHEEIIQLINKELQHFNWNKNPYGLYEPIEYVLSLGGKRLRPALLLMSCNLFSENISEAIPPALGIEIFHTFTLLHDDLMDKADLRRGHLTVHKKWNENIAILSGDVMQTIAFQLMTKAPSACLKKCLDLFSQTAIEVCEGQQYDMEFEKRQEVLPEEYLEMIRLKTAVLLGASMKIGAWLGGAPEEDAQTLYEAGINMGIAFQLKDDLLDVYGNSAEFGKKIGGDILCNKKTFLLIQALNLARGKEEKILKKWLQVDENRGEEKVKAITDVYNQLGIKEICENEIQFFSDKALEKLHQISVPENKKSELLRLTRQLVLR
ncbi:MAG TPA: polyprenyl synthetase family protein, partial [Paludibacteraceae bacterium]|nr:polyprenyl synthetase family protein [Paludibacteraceae bacterium]